MLGMIAHRTEQRRHRDLVPLVGGTDGTSP
jgi:hypothetical protein